MWFPARSRTCSMRGLNTGDGRAVFEKAIEMVSGLLAHRAVDQC